MKTFYSLLLILLLTVIHSISNANTLNFNTRISDGSSYSTGTSFMDGPITVSSGVSLDFETIIETKSSSGINIYSINLPTGFIYENNIGQSYQNGAGVCNPTNIEYYDNLFKLTLPASDCIYEYYLKYKTISGGNYRVSATETNSLNNLTELSVITINVSGTNTILEANSLDSNNDGILDGYFIITTNPAISGDFSGLNISGATILNATQSGSTGTGWIISFTGLTSSTSSLPDISGTFGGNPINNANILENDTTPPVILGVLSTGTTYTGSQIINLSNTSENATLYYSTGGIPTTSSTMYTTGIVINSNTTLNILAVDKYNNSKIYTYTYNFTCGTNPTNGTYGTYPTCTISCNSGYHIEGSTCVVNVSNPGGGGGGGGGGAVTDFCPNGDKSGNFYDSKCESTTSTGSTNTGTTSTGSDIGEETGSGEENISSDITYQEISDINTISLDNIEKTYFKNFNEANKYIELNTTNSKTKKIIESLIKKLTFDGIEYFITYDQEFVREYNKIINAFVIFSVNLDKYNNGEKTDNIKLNISKSYKMVLDGIKIIDSESKKEKVNFDDIEDSFAKNDIIFLGIKGAVKGYDGKYYRPNSKITRAEFLAIIMRTLNIEVNEVVTKTSFSDIPKGGEWMIKYVEKAKEFAINGWTIKNKSYFRPNDPITRAEAIAMLFRISGIKLEKSIKSSFSDIPKGGEWMIQYLETAKNLGVISGQIIDSKLLFRPNDGITRAETAKIITKTYFLNK